MLITSSTSPPGSTAITRFGKVGNPPAPLVPARALEEGAAVQEVLGSRIARGYVPLGSRRSARGSLIGGIPKLGEPPCERRPKLATLTVRADP